MQSQVCGDSAFQWDSQVVVIAWCASSAAALDLIGSLRILHLTLSGNVSKNGAKNTPDGKAEALADAICQCSHEGSDSLRLPFPPSPFASHCRSLWWSLKMHWPKVQVAQWTMLIISRDMILLKAKSAWDWSSGWNQAVFYVKPSPHFQRLCHYNDIQELLCNYN